MALHLKIRMRGTDRSPHNETLILSGSEVPFAILPAAVPSIFRMVDRGGSLDINDLESM